MTTDLALLLDAVLDAPADDTARLVYADALAENGDPHLGEFIRRGCRFGQHRMGGAWPGLKVWHFNCGPRQRKGDSDAVRRMLPPRRGWPDWSYLEFVRGFVAAAILASADGLMVLGDLLARHPVEIISMRPDGDEVLRVDLMPPDGVRRWSYCVTDASGYQRVAGDMTRAELVARLPRVIDRELGR